MKSQRAIFLENEADAWLERNRTALLSFDAGNDPILRLLRPHLRVGMTGAEVGCALAGRTAELAKITATRALGVEPSARAVEEANALHPTIQVLQGTAEDLPWLDASVDVLVYGFCLYLCDRSDLFRIAAEGDRVLRDGGLLAVLDFHPPVAYKNPYSHQSGVFSYKMDYTQLWTWNPAYTVISREVFDHHHRVTPGLSTFIPDERIAVSVLKKLPGFAYPLRPDHGTA